MTSHGETAQTSDSGSAGLFDNLWTAPNAFTLLRLLCLPIFLWLLFAQDNRAGAAWMLVALASTDWIDGYIARRFDQVSEFGKIFDPTVDRLFFFVSVIAIVIDGSIPVWFAVAVLFPRGGSGRDDGDCDTAFLAWNDSMSTGGARRRRSSSWQRFQAF